MLYSITGLYRLLLECRQSERVSAVLVLYAGLIMRLDIWSFIFIYKFMYAASPTTHPSHLRYIFKVYYRLVVKIRSYLQFYLNCYLQSVVFNHSLQITSGLIASSVRESRRDKASQFSHTAEQFNPIFFCRNNSSVRMMSYGYTKVDTVDHQGQRL